MRISVAAFIPAAPFQAIASRASRRSPAGSGPTHRQNTTPGGGVYASTGQACYFLHVRGGYGSLLADPPQWWPDPLFASDVDNALPRREYATTNRSGIANVAKRYTYFLRKPFRDPCLSG